MSSLMRLLEVRVKKIIPGGVTSATAATMAPTAVDGRRDASGAGPYGIVSAGWRCAGIEGCRD